MAPLQTITDTLITDVEGKLIFLVYHSNIIISIRQSLMINGFEMEATFRVHFTFADYKNKESVYNF